MLMHSIKTCFNHFQGHYESLQFNDKALTIDPSSIEALSRTASFLAELEKG